MPKEHDIPEGVDPADVDENGDWPWTLDDVRALMEDIPDPHDRNCPVCMMMNGITRFATKEAAQLACDHHNEAADW